MITDRVVLDRAVAGHGGRVRAQPGTIVTIGKDSWQLRAALEGNTARIIVTTLQKFPVVAQAATRWRGRGSR